jgi:hypothetical protein
MGGPRSGSFAGFDCLVIKSQHKGFLFAAPRKYSVFFAKEIFNVNVILLVGQQYDFNNHHKCSRGNLIDCRLYFMK